MSSLRYLFLTIALFHTAPAYQALAQTADAKSLFERGLILYRNGDIERARSNFQVLRSDPSAHSYRTIATLMLAKSAEFLGDFERTAELAASIINDEPDSRYIADAHYLLARIQVRKGQFYAAAQYLLRALETAQSEQLVERCDQLADRITGEEVGIRDLENLQRYASSDIGTSWLALWRARLHHRRGEGQARDSVLRGILASNPGSSLSAKARQLLAMPAPAAQQRIRVGVILPLTGFFASEASDLLRGMAVALENSENEEIDLIIQDSKGTLIETVRSTRRLIENGDLTLCIGDLEGTSSAVAAGLLDEARIPLIIPIASDNGLAALGESVFQANSDLETRARVLARYALDVLGMKTFATLAPVDDYGHALTDAFTQRIDELGGTIIAQQWYYPGTQDFNRQFLAIREAGFRYAFRDSLRLAGIAPAPAKIDSIYRIIDRRVREESEEKTGLLKSLDIPVASIDGFFFPIYEEDIKFVAPQFALANIRARPMGGRFWANGDILRRQRNYINGALFVSGYFVPETDLKFREYQTLFRQLTFTSPGALSLYGYNVMKLLIDAVERGNVTRNSLVHYLHEVDAFSGIGGEIAFKGHGGVNSAVQLLQFQDGNIHRLPQQP